MDKTAKHDTKSQSINDSVPLVDNPTDDKDNGINNAASKVTGQISKVNNTQMPDTEMFDLDGLDAYLKSEGTKSTGRGIPPLDKWHPERSGTMDLVIKANGEWWHEGSKMTRESLVQLFSTVLWLEEDDGESQYYLKTPVEKLRIEVEDVPFFITDVNIVEKQNLPWLEFVTKTGDVVYLDEDRPIVMRKYQKDNNGSEMRPYIKVRFGMYGLISRSVFMHLTKLGVLSEQNGMTILTLNSGGNSYDVSVDSGN